jgi:hypothetical protein
MFGISAYGEKTTAEMLGGASFSLLSDTLGGFYDVARYAIAESGDETMPVAGDALIKLASNSATFSHWYKAMMIHNYGVLLSNKGTVLLNDVPDRDAFAMALLGVRPGETDTLAAHFEYNQRHKEAVNETAIALANQRARWVFEPDNRGDIEAQSNLIVRLAPAGVRGEALRRVQKMMPDTLGQELERQYQRKRTEQIMETQAEEAQQQ